MVIAKRRKEEHVSAYACVGIGAQLFAIVPDDAQAICADDEDNDDEEDGLAETLPLSGNRDTPPSL